jgi:hypothetical protein
MNYSRPIVSLIRLSLIMTMDFTSGHFCFNGAKPAKPWSMSVVEVRTAIDQSRVEFSL